MLIKEKLMIMCPRETVSDTFGGALRSDLIVRSINEVQCNIDTTINWDFYDIHPTFLTELSVGRTPRTCDSRLISKKGNSEVIIILKSYILQ